MFTYVCMCCEDTEEYNNPNLLELCCECGGEMYLERTDSFVEVKEICHKCLNYATLACITCVHERRYRNETKEA